MQRDEQKACLRVTGVTFHVIPSSLSSLKDKYTVFLITQI